MKEEKEDEEKTGGGTVGGHRRKTKKNNKDHYGELVLEDTYMHACTHTYIGLHTNLLTYLNTYLPMADPGPIRP